MSGKKRVAVPLVIALAVLAVFLYSRVHARIAGGNHGIAVSGNIEVIDAELSFKINGRVAARLVDEGQQVQTGQEIARLDTAELTQQVAQRKAESELAKAALAELEAGARPQEIAEANAAVEVAQAKLDELLSGSRTQEVAAARADAQSGKAEADRLKTDVDRYQKLYADDVASAQQNDAASAAYNVAKERLHSLQEKLRLVEEGPRREQIEQARAALRQAQERRDLVREGPRKETIAQSRARLDQAQAALGLAEVQLGNATLVSPMNGVVLSKNTEPGEYVSPGTPIVTVGDIEHVFLRAYIAETDLGRVKLGQTAEITTDTFAGKVYTGTVSFIAPQAEFTPKTVQTAKERVKLVYRVKIDIANPDMELKPGMPADAAIQTDH